MFNVRVCIPPECTILKKRFYPIHAFGLEPLNIISTTKPMFSMSKWKVPEIPP
jgi:hypothetical protein